MLRWYAFAFHWHKVRVVLVLVLCLVAVNSIIDDNNCGTLGFVVEAAFPVLLQATLSITKVSESIDDQEILSASLRCLIVNSVHCEEEKNVSKNSQTCTIGSVS